MKRIVKIVVIILAAAILFCVGILVADKRTLQSQIIRMHVVADSDEDEDQAAKLAVRDAATDYLSEKLNGITDIESVRQILSVNLDDLEEIANSTLTAVGSHDVASVTLARESFDKRIYDTFSLPAGIYESLRIQIGSGEGKNWWCVVFPAFCTPTDSRGFEAAAVSNGFNNGLAEALSNEPGNKYRFFILDCIGHIEKIFTIS